VAIVIKRPERQRNLALPLIRARLFFLRPSHVIRHYHSIIRHSNWQRSYKD